MTPIRQRLLEVFEIEYQEHLAAIRALLAETGRSIVIGDLTEATRRAHSLKGAARAVGIEEVEGLAHGLESLFIRIGRGEAALDRDLKHHIADVLDEIEDRVVASQAMSAAPAAQPRDSGKAATPTLVSIAEEGSPPAAAPDAARNRPTSVRIEAGNLDQLLRSAGELHSDMLYQHAGARNARAVAHQLRALETRWQGLWKQLEGSLRKETGRHGRSRLAAGGDHIGAQIKLISREAAAAADAQDQCTRHLRRHLADLESRVKTARMVPSESAFGAFRKMVRDVAMSEGKQVEIVIDGLDSQADRLVLQRIKDPVMHMLRNAVSHGIEPPAERQAKRKSATGHISLHVATERDRLSIAIEDDGRGIDFRRIGDKAVAQGLLARKDAESASDETLSQLLFEPGFSTADVVTRISGRGVGLSVAREAVTSLQGTLAIRSQLGQGTRIEVSLPVSIVARRLLQVAFRQQTYALPADCVIKVLRISVKDIVTVEGRPAVQFNGATLPLMSIGDVLGAGDSTVTTEKATACVVVLRSGGSHVGVVVEDFGGVNEFVVRMLDFGSGQRPWSGIISTEDGSPCLVLNADAFAGAGHGAIVFRARQKQDAEKVVLVVDDSITTRTLEKSILEANGYKVRLSVDGRDAIAQLRTDRADIVVSDIEMPHLNGFDLVRSMKADKALAAIPIILVTSRDDPADRERGLLLGADAYVVKQRFDQNELLRTIKQII